MASGFTPFPLLLAIKCQLVGNTILVAITVLVVALRVVTRLVTGSKLGWDDYLILAAVPQSIGMLVCQGLCKSLHTTAQGNAPSCPELY